MSSQTYVIFVLVAAGGVGIVTGIVWRRGAFFGLVFVILGLFGWSSFDVGSLFPIVIGSGVMIGAAARSVVDRRRRKAAVRELEQAEEKKGPQEAGKQ